MSEEQMIQYAKLRAQRLALNGAQTFNYVQRVVQHWLSGKQAEQALTEAAREVQHG